jgi:hypothetical protein
MNEERRLDYKVPSIKATVRRSEKHPGRDSWLTMELSAERSVQHIDPAEDIISVADLAQELDVELRKVMMWDSNSLVSDDRNEIVEASVCPDHGENYKRYEKDGDIWWSHKLDSGSWCKKPS